MSSTGTRQEHLESAISALKPYYGVKSKEDFLLLAISGDGTPSTVEEGVSFVSEEAQAAIKNISNLLDGGLLVRDLLKSFDSTKQFYVASGKEAEWELIRDQIRDSFMIVGGLQFELDDEKVKEADPGGLLHDSISFTDMLPITGKAVNKSLTPNKSEPSLALIQVRPAALNLSTRDSGAVDLFMNSIPTLEWSRAIPYLNVMIVNPSKNFELNESTTSPMRGSLQLFLMGESAIADSAVADLSMAEYTSEFLEQFLGDINTPLNDNLSLFMDMSSFTSPQTLIPANEDYQSFDSVGLVNDESSAMNVGRSGPILDRMRPFMTLENFSVSVKGTRGMMSTRAAKMNIVLHDRSRLGEIGDLVRPSAFGNNEILVEYGWSHPDGNIADPSPYSEFGRFLNSMKVKEKYGVKNTSYNFTDDGQVKITLELVTKGADVFNLYDVALTPDSQASWAAVEEIIDTIRTLRRKCFPGKQMEDVDGVSTIASISKSNAHEIFSGDSMKEINTFIRSVRNNRKTSQDVKELAKSLGRAKAKLATHTRDLGTLIGAKINELNDGNDPFMMPRERVTEFSSSRSVRNWAPKDVTWPLCPNENLRKKMRAVRNSASQHPVDISTYPNMKSKSAREATDKHAQQQQEMSEAGLEDLANEQATRAIMMQMHMDYVQLNTALQEDIVGQQAKYQETMFRYAMSGIENQALSKQVFKLYGPTGRATHGYSMEYSMTRTMMDSDNPHVERMYGMLIRGQDANASTRHKDADALASMPIAQLKAEIEAYHRASVERLELIQWMESNTDRRNDFQHGIGQRGRSDAVHHAGGRKQVIQTRAGTINWDAYGHGSKTPETFVRQYFSHLAGSTSNMKSAIPGVVKNDAAGKDYRIVAEFGDEQLIREGTGHIYADIEDLVPGAVGMNFRGGMYSKSPVQILGTLVRVGSHSALEQTGITQQGQEDLRRSSRADVRGKRFIPVFGAWKYASVGKIFASFVGQPLCATQKFDEVQILFYCFNDRASWMWSQNISSMPIKIDDFKKRLEDWRKARGNVSIKTFLQFMNKAFFASMTSEAYGFSSFYTWDKESLGTKVTKNRRGKVYSAADIASGRDITLAKAYINSNDDQNLIFKRPSLCMYVESIPARARGDEEESATSTTILRIHIYDRAATKFSGVNQLLALAKNSEIGNMKTGLLPLVKLEGDKLGGLNSMDAARHQIQYNNTITKALNANLIAKETVTIPAVEGGPEEYKQDIFLLNGGPEALKYFIKSTMPNIILGSPCSAVQAASVSSQHNSANSSMHMVRQHNKNNQQKNMPGADEMGLPLRMSPMSVSMDFFGCPLLNFGQQFFIDFGTNTSIDDVYGVVGVDHSMSPGEFKTSAKFVKLESYGKFESLITMMNKASSMIHTVEMKSTPGTPEDPEEK